jgi:hypothetical protein
MSMLNTMMSRLYLPLVMKNRANWLHLSICGWLLRLTLLPLVLVLTTMITEALGWAPSDRLAHAQQAEPSSTVRAVITEIATSAGLPRVIMLKYVDEPPGLMNDQRFENLPDYSLDGGQTWNDLPSGDGRSSYLAAIAPRTDPTQPVRIVRAENLSESNNDSLYRTGDFGQSWAEINLSAYNFVGSWLSDLTVSPVDAQRIYVIEHGYDYYQDCSTIVCIQVPVFSSSLYTSQDGGVTWGIRSLAGEYSLYSIVPSPIVSSIGSVRAAGGWYDLATGTPHAFPGAQLVLDAQDPARLYGLEFPSPLEITPTVSITGVTSVDSGATWQPWASLPADDCQQLMAHPTKSSILYLRCAQGLYRSVDSGDHWEMLAAVGSDLLAPDYGVRGRLLWARIDGLWASTDDGENWVQLAPAWTFSRNFLPLIDQ